MALPLHKRNVDVGMAVVVLFGVPVIAAFLMILGYLSTEEQIDGVTTTLLSQKVATFQLPHLQRRNKIQAPWVIALTADREVRIGPMSPKRILVELVVTNKGVREELAHFELEDSWNDIIKQKAFLYMDPARRFIFLPGSRAHYIFSTTNQTLRLVRTLPTLALRRVVSVDDVLLIIGRKTLSAFSTKSWKDFGTIAY